MAIPSLALSNERSLAIPFHSLVVSSGGNPSQLPSSVLTFKEVRESHHHKAQGVRRSVEGVERESASSCFGRPHSRTRNQGEPEEEEEASWSLLASFSTSLALSFSLSLSVASAEPNHPPTAPQEGGEDGHSPLKGNANPGRRPARWGHGSPDEGADGTLGVPGEGGGPGIPARPDKTGRNSDPGSRGGDHAPRPGRSRPGAPVRVRRPAPTAPQGASRPPALVTVGLRAGLQRPDTPATPPATWTWHSRSSSLGGTDLH